ncbi:OmpP1/FadL family transporter [Pontibacter roseus]|uniref:OmpP1/FadL family transporter n=1 Tax=Pontibacter roseus TaxID=336989 RepID=UPI0003757453|nr:hypothetical protein [Pontibacter roseus]
MKMNKIVSASLALMLGWGGTAFAQNEVDALRYTRYGLTGSARIQGIGGAQTALGADVSTMASNPAGLGMFRRSEFSISPGMTFSTSKGSVFGTTTTDERNSLGIPHAAFVFSERQGEPQGDWTGATFGLSFTRLNNFNNRTSYRNTAGGQDPTIVEYFTEQANLRGRTKADLDREFDDGFTSLEGLAFGTYLFDVVQDANGKDVFLPTDRVGNINQSEEIIRRGSQNQIDIAGGTSYKDKVYLGASLGVITSDFRQERFFRESEENPDTDFTSLELRDEFRTRGTGLNLKVGIIVKPSDIVRFGASIQTPTFYNFNETFERSLYSTFLPGENYGEQELPGEFSYKLTTPFRANGGVAFFLQKYGFITADIEYVNYANASFGESDDFGGNGSYFNDVNDRISDTYQSALNFRLGAEARYEVFRFRAGYAITGDPYKNADFDGSIHTFTLGTGLRLNKYYADIAFASSTANSLYAPYTFSDPAAVVPLVDVEDKQNTVMLTVGYNF